MFHILFYTADKVSAAYFLYTAFLSEIHYDSRMQLRQGQFQKFVVTEDIDVWMSQLIILFLFQI